MAISTIGISLYKGDVELTNLTEVPELADGEKDTIEITTLKDEYHTFMDGLGNFADTITFKFLYEKLQYMDLLTEKNEAEYKVLLPDGIACKFTGKATVKMDSIAVGGALTYTLNVKPTSKIQWYQEP